MDLKCLVISLQRMTVHNGPGMRTLILFKGCPLHCMWCSTPESQSPESEIAIYPSKCIHCEECISVCPLRAIELESNTLCVNRSLCNSCGKCVQVCYAEALKLIGQPMTIEELIEEVRKESIMYKYSGGGVTLSGGEPLLNYKFNQEFLPALKGEGINVGIDTCGYAPWKHIDPILPYVDFFLWDIKIMNPTAHKRLTGISNRMILNNARRISKRNVPLYIRIPLIPGHNDSEANLRATCVFAKSLSSVVQIDLLPLHHLGKSRYESLDLPYPIASIPLIPDDVLANMKHLVEAYGLKCTIGG